MDNKYEDIFIVAEINNEEENLSTVGYRTYTYKEACEEATRWSAEYNSIHVVVGVFDVFEPQTPKVKHTTLIK